MRQCDETVEWLRALARALLAQARGAADVAVAAHTHLQPAQPVRLAHLWLAHVTRSSATKSASKRREKPPTACRSAPARWPERRCATTALRSRAPRVLAIALNTLDAVGDRDFAVQYLNAAALLGVHLSRLSEDLVLFCSPAFGWFRAPDGFSTGSSLLPQKRNPDLFELARGKSARLIANAQQLATLLKGLPSSYQKDLQEDKAAVFDTADTLDALLDAIPPAIDALKPNRTRIARQLTQRPAGRRTRRCARRARTCRSAMRTARWARCGQPPRALAARWRHCRSRSASHCRRYFTDARLAALSVEAAIARRTHAPGAGSTEHQLAIAEGRLGLGPGDDADMPAPEDVVAKGAVRAPRATSERAGEAAAAGREADTNRVVGEGLILRRARVADVTGIAGVMAPYVVEGTLLPRPVSELYQCVREFHVVERVASGDAPATIVACAALRLLWKDLGEVRSLAVRPDAHGKGLGAALVEAVVADARALGLPRIIALTREVGFFQRSGFGAEQREAIPRKVWTDCVRCPEAACVRRGRHDAGSRARRLGRGRSPGSLLCIAACLPLRSRMTRSCP